ncbi:hypothetical protein [Angustibacter sp. Root456]|uniref:hypothetical protein n=1 Tax=Angustibacter sp. Root456 TaxID=1736539 RepID=UPI00190FC100|nr:hypothetical protein [Angustibacter sp. Root456]
MSGTPARRGFFHVLDTGPPGLRCAATDRTTAVATSESCCSGGRALEVGVGEADGLTEGTFAVRVGVGFASGAPPEHAHSRAVVEAATISARAAPTASPRGCLMTGVRRHPSRVA